MTSLAVVRRERLRGEYQRLLELQADSRMISLHPLSSSDAPDRYRITMRCRGIVALNNGTPEFGQDHTIEMQLPANFPQHGPSIRSTTMIYHPNIMFSLNGQVCINQWTPLRRLDEVVEQIYNMVRYLPDVTNPKSPYNSEAAIWYREQQKRNTDLFPTDTRPIRGGAIINIVDSLPAPGNPTPTRGTDPKADIQIVFVDSVQPAGNRTSDDLGIVIH